MKILTLALFLALPITAAAQTDSFTFRSQQSVYIVAVRSTIGDPSLSTLDLSAEKEIRDAFAKRALFKIAPSLSKADFVFLCITDYRGNPEFRVVLNALALAETPQDFEANRSDLIKLRDLALWQQSKSSPKGFKLKSVVEDFHKFALKK